MTCAGRSSSVTSATRAPAPTGGNNMQPVLFSWSGGKDSALALEELLRGGEYEVVALLTTVAGQFKRISHHGVREELLDLQAAALDIPLDKLYLPVMDNSPCTN